MVSRPRQTAKAFMKAYSKRMKVKQRPNVDHNARLQKHKNEYHLILQFTLSHPYPVDTQYLKSLLPNPGFPEKRKIKLKDYTILTVPSYLAEYRKAKSIVKDYLTSVGMPGYTFTILYRH